MPLTRCQLDNKPGWKWGDAGKCYPYTAGDEASEKAARRKATAQAAAMGEFPGTGQQRDTVTIEVEHRSATVHDIDTRKRLIDLVMVPYDQEVDVFWQNDIWHESHDRHAYDGIENHAGRIQVNREHTKGRTVGKVVAMDPAYQAGLFGRAAIYPTELGDETLILAEHGGAFPSIGFRVNRPSDMRLDKRARTRRILRAFLDHLAFVEDPAYQTEVLAVRAGQSGLAVARRPLLETPALDEALNDPVLMAANQRFNR